MNWVYAIEKYGSNFIVLKGVNITLPDGAKVAIYRNNTGSYITEAQNIKIWADTPDFAAAQFLKKVFSEMLKTKKDIEESVIAFNEPIASYHNGKIAG